MNSFCISFIIPGPVFLLEIDINFINSSLITSNQLKNRIKTANRACKVTLVLSSKQIEKILLKLNQLKADLLHRHSYKIYVNGISAMSLVRFITSFFLV